MSKISQWVASGLAALFLLSVEAAWAKRYAERYCQQPGYQCIIIERGQTWASLWPDAYQREVVQRLNRMNIPLRKGMRIAVPDEIETVTLWDISPFALQETAQGEKIIYVSLKELAWGAYDEDGQLIYWGPVSGGKNWCKDVGRSCRTAQGSHQFIRKQGAGCVSSKFPLGRGGAPMPYCMFFYRGFAMHGSPTVPGYHASHGCVRLFKEDARWLNEEFIDLPSRMNTYKGTRIEVLSY